MKSRENKILLAIDFQKQSLISLDYAYYYAKITDAEVVILHVIDEGNFLMKMFRTDEIREKVKSEATRFLKRIEEKLGAAVKVRTILTFGKPYEKIIETAQVESPMFILMGKEEKPGYSYFVGSNTLHVIESSDFPVVTVRGSHYISDESPDKDIVVPLDLTKNVTEQISVAIDFAKYFGSRVRIVSVLNEKSVALEMKLLTKLNRAKEVFEDAGIECTARLIKETKIPVQDVILDFLTEEDSHLVIVMTQAEDKTSQHYLGSSAKAFVERSPVPVCTVNPWPYESSDSFYQLFTDPFGLLHTKTS